HDLSADELACLGVAGPVPRQAVELERLAEDQRTIPAVRRRPAERVEAERHDRRALLHCDHQPAGVDRAPGAESLARAPARDADEMPVPPHLAGPAQGVAVALTASDRDDAHQFEPVADHWDLEQLRLREEVGRAGDEAADQGMVDAREVVGGEHGTASARYAL